MTDDESKPAKDRQPGAPKQSGRVAYDAKGNPVWEWETSTGVFDRNVSTQRLKKLEAKLSLEETQPVPKQKGLELQEGERLPGGGINPYNTDGPANERTPAAAVHPALVHKQLKKEPISNSLASKYAAAAKRKQQAPPQSFWQKFLARFKGK